MGKTVEVRLPDIGDFDQVDVIEVLVAEGDSIEAEASMITLESDKATMEIPSPHSGVVKKLKVAVGDKIAEGAVVLDLEIEEAAEDLASEAPAEQPPAAAQETVKESQPVNQGEADYHAEVLVLGAGPGGYTAAFRAADLGKKTVLIEKYSDLGGVCLNVGCIPSKALLHTADIINEAQEIAHMGITFAKPKIDLDAVRDGKEKVVKKLTGGLGALAKQRKVEVITGLGQFSGPNSMSVATADGDKTVSFDHCIIACGSSAVKIPSFPNDDPRLIDSTGALALENIPQKMLVIGGGIIGLEMATVYSAFGSDIDVVELQPGLIPGCDRDLVRPLQKRLQHKVNSIMLETSVTEIKAQKNGLKVSFDGKNAPDKAQLYDKVLVAVGRSPNGNRINAGAAGVNVDERGFIAVDEHMQTNVAHIYAIGDVVGNPMLAHKATHEAKVAAEVIAGHKSLFDPLTIPSVAYTDPEVAWMGLTETDAKEQGIEYEKGLFPWAASGRALGVGRDEGMTKLLFDPETKRIIGAGIVGVSAGELIGETVLALEMGADMEDIGLTIHPHPTLNETICFAAEMAEGSITDLMPPRKRKK
ncbi:MAG: dihydrolipoyl dehydrogenase [Gammaproteobacteria bacterium]|nr:dihydrolipoyl dehydrogenase [Gammaproteobacteria bacterium]